MSLCEIQCSSVLITQKENALHDSRLSTVNFTRLYITTEPKSFCFYTVGKIFFIHMPVAHEKRKQLDLKKNVHIHNYNLE